LVEMILDSALKRMMAQELTQLLYMACGCLVEAVLKKFMIGETIK
jgi:hypothetical protein